MHARFLVTLTALGALAAQAQDFETPNRQLAEKSQARACDGFSAFLTAQPDSPLAREAKVKRAAACAAVGKGRIDELRTFADTGEKDFARAWAAHALYERGDRTLDPALALLKQAAEGSGRTAEEAKQLLARDALTELERQRWDLARVEAMTEVALAWGSPGQQAQARFTRAHVRLDVGQKVPEAERDLAALGEGQSEVADDALFLLANRRESERKYEAALGLYDGLVKRFSPTTSNVHASAKDRAAEIRRPWVSLSAEATDLPGATPRLTVTWRNVTSATYTLTRVDPLRAAAGDYPDDPDDYLKTAVETVSSWKGALTVKTLHEPGSLSLDAPVKGPGAYVVQVDAEGHRARAWLLVTQTALATKTDGTHLLVFLADAETGAAQADAEVAVFVDEYDHPNLKLTQTTDAQGVARFEVPRGERSMRVWARKGTWWATSAAGGASQASWGREELAYVLTDRPLYKPGETVGLKLFLRSRQGGPSSPMSGQAVTLEVYDPQGKRVLSAPITTNQFGTGVASLALPKGAPLGQWAISLRGGNYRGNLRGFRVEEYKPPEYTVSVEPVGSPRLGEAVTVRVKAAYFSGGPVPNATGRALVTVTPWDHQWGRWPDEPTAESPQWGEDEEWTGRRGYRPWYGAVAQHTLPFRTGADGTAELTVPAVTEQGYQGYSYALQVFVTDASRREISGQGQVTVSKASAFVDVRTTHDLYRPGERVSARLRAEDANGRPVSLPVLARLSRLKDDGTLATISEVRSTITDGKGALVLDADALGRARLEIFPEAGAGAPLAQTDLWLTSDTKPLSPPAQGFQLYVDRAPIALGGSVRALVATNRPGGHALVTVESDALHASRVVELKGRAAFVELPVNAGMAPNAWVYAVRFEDTLGLTQQQPVRISGSEVQVPVKVSLGRETVEPGAAVTAQVQTGIAGAAELALTVVDEALYALEPAPTDFLSFFGRTPRQQLVRTALSHFDRSYRARPKPEAKRPEDPKRAQPPELRPAESRSEDKESAAEAAPPTASTAPMGGAPARRAAKSALADDASEPVADQPGHRADLGAVKARTDFSTSAGYFPQLALKGGAASQAVTLKDSLTSWRATATVVTPGAELGQGAGTVRTAKTLMVRLQAPRFFVEGDEVVLSAVIESHLPKAADVEVLLSAPGFKALGPAQATLKVEPEKPTRFDAKFKVVELGERPIKAVVRAGAATDAMEWALPAFVHGSAQRQFFSGRLGARNAFTFTLPEKRKPGLTRLELTLSPTLLSVMFDGLPYLAQYPYGCVEQTLSRFVPATIARKAVHDLHLPTARVPDNLDDMVSRGVERLVGFQHADGGWGWWHDDATNDWMTAYVVYALALAKDAGLSLDPSVVARGRRFLVDHLGRQLDTPETHAFMVFALASSGGAPKAAVDQLFARRAGLSARARAQLALALLATKDARARTAVENLDDVVKAAQSRPDASVGEATDAWSTSAAIEATAFTLMAYTRYDLHSPLIAPLTDFLVLRRNGGRWRNTRDTAFAIYALAELARAEKATQARAAYVLSVNGKEVRRFSLGDGLAAAAPIVLGDADLKPGTNSVQLTRDGAGAGYWAATFDAFNQNDFIKGVGGDVAVKRTYTLLGRPSTERPAGAGAEYGMPVESGVRVRVDLELTANKAVEFVMVEDLKPAGFEAVEQRSGPAVCAWACAHAELRTDRVAMFLPELKVGTTKVSYELRAEAPGRFAALPARLEAMYAPELQATADEMRFEVRDEPTSVAGKGR